MAYSLMSNISDAQSHVTVSLQNHTVRLSDGKKTKENALKTDWIQLL